MIAGATLDHVAVAAERLSDVLDRYGHDLSGRWHSGGGEVGFTAHQFAYADSCRVETIMPFNVERDDFLRRFLDRSGPGPHHLTFTVDDLPSALEELDAAGYRVVNVQLDVPGLEQGFIHPKDALGTVVQVVGHRGDHGVPSPPGFPAPRTTRPATLLYIVQSVPSLDEGLKLYAGVLAGAERTRGDGPEGRWVELGWPGSGRLRLVEAPAGPGPGATGRIDHLAFSVERPSEIEGVISVPDQGWILPGAVNSGTRLRLIDAGTAPEPTPSRSSSVTGPGSRAPC